jgi:starvation-inducible DNA-binding protein
MADLEKDQVKMVKPNIGLNDEVVEKTVNVLQKLLADETVLYMQLRNYHWNVTGPNFIQFHQLFEEQYNALPDVIDNIAERIRSYGVAALGTLTEILEHARLTEAPGELPTAREMVENLVESHETIIRYLRDDIEVMDDIDNDGEEDQLIGLVQDHQKQAWLLRAHLEG